MWLFADTSLELFNSIVPIATLSRPGTVIRGATGLVEADIGGALTWTCMQRVRPSNRSDWLEEKRSGSGRDSRIGSLTVPPDALVLPLFRESVETGEAVLSLPPSFRGPRAEREVTTAIVASGLEPRVYYDTWVTTSGINAASGLATEHLWLVMSLYFIGVVARLSQRNLTVSEHICRRLLQVERAVRRNARAPDFSGLTAYSDRLGVSGAGVRTPAFSQYVAEDQRTEAQILKQSRLAREESEADSKRHKEKPDRQGGKQKDKKPAAQKEKKPEE